MRTLKICAAAPVANFENFGGPGIWADVRLKLDLTFELRLDAPFDLNWTAVSNSDFRCFRCPNANSSYPRMFHQDREGILKRIGLQKQNYLFSIFFRAARYRHQVLTIKIRRKLKRNQTRKHRRGNLREGREAPLRRSLPLLRFCFRFFLIYV